MPTAFCARMRRKYTPGGTPLNVADVCVLSGTMARLLNPDEDPASRTYDVTAPPVVGGDHDSVTVLPLTFADSPDGAPGSDPGAVLPGYSVRIPATSSLPRPEARELHDPCG